jgi:hypothetical protein
MAAALLVLLLAAASAAPLAEAGYEAIDVHLSHDLCCRPHDELFDALHRAMGGTIPILEIHGHRFLSAKDADRESPPSRTINLHLTAGCCDEDRVTLALSDGDAGVMAYADGAGQWHAFPGFEHLFPGSTTLPFNASYDDLIGGHRNLPAVPLGRTSALEAVLALSRPGTTTPTPTPTPERDAKAAALARLMIMTTEALRWKPIREAFGGGRWESESFLTMEQAELVLHPRWVDLSYLVWRWEVTGAWGEEGVDTKGLEKIGVHNAARALAIADLLKRPKELCVGDGRAGWDGEDEDEEAGEGGAAAAALHQDI